MSKKKPKPKKEREYPPIVVVKGFWNDKNKTEK
jgi:hypothetical protein